MAHPEGEIILPGFMYNLHEELSVGIDRVELDTVICGLGSYPLEEAECLTVESVNSVASSRNYTRSAAAVLVSGCSGCPHG